MSAPEPYQELQVGEDLYVIMVPIADLRERDVNAQILSPRHMDRLTENIRQRGQVESLPYISWPNREGPLVILSGHHRFRAARSAELEVIPCLVDTMPMTESQRMARQIAHNEIHGAPDEAILAQMVAAIDNVDDLLTTGLPEDWLPTPGDDDTQLGLPHAEFDWRLVTLLFLPRQLSQFESALDVLDRHSEIVGIAPREDFEEFSKEVVQFGRTMNIRSIATSVGAIIQIARREVEQALADGVKPDGTWKRAAEVVGPQIPADAAEVIGQAIEKVMKDEGIPADQPWRAIEFICADFNGGA